MSEVEGRPRYTAQDMNESKKQKIIVVVVALIRRENKVLMTLRDEKVNRRSN